MAFENCFDIEYNEYTHAQFLGNESNPYVVLVSATRFNKMTKSFVIPEGTKIILDHAFEKCIGITNLVIPDSIVSIGIYAFYRCDSLTEIRYSGSESQWNAVEKALFWDENAGNFTVMYNYTGE